MFYSMMIKQNKKKVWRLQETRNLQPFGLHFSLIPMEWNRMGATYKVVAMFGDVDE